LNRLIGGELAQRVLPEGGYADRPRGRFRSDSTAWGVLASRALGVNQGDLERHCSRLFKGQGQDGRVYLSPQHPKSYWPTAVAFLAWQGSPAIHSRQNLAVQFLLGTTGVHFERKPDDIVTHDTSLRGWPWIEETHSWVEPTAMCVMALRATGQA